MKLGKEIMTGSIVAVVLLATIGSVAASDSFKSEKQGFRNSTEDQKIEMGAHRAGMKEIMDAGDYDAFLEAVSDQPRAEERLEEMTEEKFEKMVEAHKLRESGDIEGARGMMQKLGMSKRMRKGGRKNMTDEQKVEREVHRAEMKEIMEAGDYDAFLEAVSDQPRAEERLEEMTEEKFEKMVEAHKLRESGDYEGVKEIMKELGIRKRMNRGSRSGFGQNE